LTLLTELLIDYKISESIENLQNLRISNIDETLVIELPSAIRMLAKLPSVECIVVLKTGRTV